MTLSIVTSSGSGLKRFLWIFFCAHQVMAASVDQTAVDHSAWRPGQPMVTVEPENNPFWRSKEKVWRKVKDERATIASVVTRSAPAGSPRHEELYMQGVGHVAAPADFCYAQAQRFADLPKVSSVIKEARYDAASQVLEFHTEAFNYHARLTMQIDLRQVDSRRDIRFRVIKGAFTGMTGVIRFEDLERRKTQISMTALFPFDKLPMPKFFAEFGLEVAIQMVASKMRSFLEDEWGRSQTPSGS